ncbi:MAG: D-sedoheptulose 7-phosphate isomerase [Candidatus Omnitrophota bacterium]|nr:D-sedoheptulose 7-phosphate isomerase [Candidatus Omnitrophota bacterium]
MTSQKSSSVSPSSYAAAIEERLTESIRTKERVRAGLIPVMEQATRLMIEALEQGSKIFFFGNGGSAADSQHLAAELVGKMFIEGRRALPAIALTTDSSNLTALGNDFGFETVFSRQIEALGKPGDVAIGITTSGQSPNVLAAVTTARKMGLKTIGFIGKDGGKLKGLVDIAIIVPSDSTQRIQESHITIGQIICELIEAHFAR